MPGIQKLRFYNIVFTVGYKKKTFIMFLNTFCQAAGLSEGHIAALLKLQSKLGAQMKELGHLHEESNESKVNPEKKWKLWVNLKVKMRA